MANTIPFPVAFSSLSGAVCLFLGPHNTCAQIPWVCTATTGAGRAYQFNLPRHLNHCFLEVIFTANLQNMTNSMANTSCTLHISPDTVSMYFPSKWIVVAGSSVLFVDTKARAFC